MNAAPHTELAVADPSRLVERLGADTHPLQQYRELTTNALEAVAHSPGPRRVVWDVDWQHLRRTDGRERKLSIADTGLGMTAQQMRDLINHLAASGDYKATGARGNFGVGAKIAAGMRNPAGLQYASFPAAGEAGALIRFGRSPDGRWGLLGVGEHGDWHQPLPDTDAQRRIPGTRHGTVVTLMGDRPTSDTTRAPAGAEGRDWWLLRYLNSRYVDLPADVELLVRPACKTPAPDDRTPALQRVHGMRALLDRHADASGHQRLAVEDGTLEAIVHWWILTDDTAQRRRCAHEWPSSGHMAAILDGETYESLPSTRGGYQRLQEFGIRFGYERVVLYVEPNRDDARLSANTARTRLVCDGEDLPWAAWAAAFRADPPAELVALQESSAARHIGRDRRHVIAQRMSAHPGVYRLPAYQPPTAPRPPRAAGSASRHARGQGSRGRRNAPAASPTTTPATAPVVDPWQQLPRCRWVTVADGTRAPGDLEDRAGRYDHATDTLTINADYRPIVALTRHFDALYGGAPGAAQTIEAVVREWCETALCEAVIAHRSLAASPAWGPADAQRLVDEIGLSAALAPVVAMTHHAARTLAQRLGKR